MFSIDFYELCFLAEACMPPSPIARTSFWQSLTSRYWEYMTEAQRASMYGWISRTHRYDTSNDDIKLFDARFNPGNQYKLLSTLHEDEYRAFLMDGKYYVSHNTFIPEEYIKTVERW